MKNTLLAIGIFLWAATMGMAQAGHQIKVNIKGYEEPELYLAYYLADKQYIQDTVKRGADGSYVFEGTENLPGGMYLIVMAPDNNFFQILIDDQNQRYQVSSDKADPIKNTRFEGSLDNQLFYNYLNYLNEQRPKAEALQKEIEAETNLKKKERLEADLKVLNDDVLSYQRKLIANHPQTLTAAIIKANLPADMPEFEGSEQEAEVKKWRWTQQHFFDMLDLSDPRLLRTPFLFQRVDNFVQKLQVQHPDTLVKAIDYVLERMKPAEETFKYYLVHFLNFYASSKYVGMDAVYVHLVDNYYAKGMAPWTNEEQLQKIIDNAATLRPLLIGRIAPDLRLQRRDGSPVSLHEVRSPYTILYFWRYDCGHCKESTPMMREFYEKFKNRGVELFAVCTKTRDEIPGCWDYIDSNDIADWMHVVDPYMRSRYNAIYDIRSTPQIYILDADKRIISKRIGAEQLEELFNQLLQENPEPARE